VKSLGVSRPQCASFQRPCADATIASSDWPSMPVRFAMGDPQFAARGQLRLRFDPFGDEIDGVLRQDDEGSDFGGAVDVVAAARDVGRRDDRHGAEKEHDRRSASRGPQSRTPHPAQLTRTPGRGYLR
jgi:hypothetical protein